MKSIVLYRGPNTRIVCVCVFYNHMLLAYCASKASDSSGPWVLDFGLVGVL